MARIRDCGAVLLLGAMSLGAPMGRAAEHPDSVLQLGHSDPKTGKENRKDLLADDAAEQARLQMKFRLAKSELRLLLRSQEYGSPAEKEVARNLRQCLARIDEEGVEGKLDALIREMTGPGSEKNIAALGEILEQNKKLRDSLNRILDLLFRYDRHTVIDRAADENLLLLKRTEAQLQEQKRVHAATRAGRQSSQDLVREQRQITAETLRLVKDLAERRWQIQDALKDQEQAETELGKDNQDGAAHHQERAIEKLEKARQRMGQLQTQLWEEETEIEEAEKRHSQAVARRFQQARRKVLSLAEQLEARDGPGDKQRARHLRAVVAIAEKLKPDYRIDALLKELAVPLADRPRLEKAYRLLTDAGSRLTVLSADLEGDGADPRALAARVGTLANETLPAAQEAIATVSAAYERLLKEADLEPRERDLSMRVFTTLSQPLRRVDKEYFARTQRALQGLERALGTGGDSATGIKAASKQASIARRELAELTGQLGDVLLILEGVTPSRATAVVRQIVVAEEEQFSRLHRIREKLINDVLQSDR